MQEKVSNKQEATIKEICRNGYGEE